MSYYYEDWIPEERDSEVLDLLMKTSAVESLSVKYPMRSDVIDIVYDVLRTEKLGTITELSLDDLEINLLEEVRLDWVRNAGIYLDSMCLGATKPPPEEDYYAWDVPVNHVRSGKIQSLYLRENLNRFYIHPENPGNLTDLLDGLAGYVEGPPVKKHQDFHYMDARPGIIAHPKFRKFIDPKKTGVVSGLPVKWSMGCVATGEPSHDPEGNPLLYIGNMSALSLGVRSGPESQLRKFDQEWADEERRRFEAGEGGFLSDMGPESLIRERLGKAWLKMRMRRAFTVNPLYPFHCVEMVG